MFSGGWTCRGSLGIRWRGHEDTRTGPPPPWGWGDLCRRRREVRGPPPPQGARGQRGAGWGPVAQTGGSTASRRGCRGGKGPSPPAAINRLHSSVNEMEMRRRDRGALSAGKNALLSTGGPAPQPGPLSAAPGSPLGTAAPGASRGTPRLGGIHLAGGSRVRVRGHTLKIKTVTRIASPECGSVA